MFHITKINKRAMLIIMLLGCILLSINMVNADDTYKGTNLTTIDSGNVSGGLYSDSYYGYDNNHVNQIHERSVVDTSDSISNSETRKSTGNNVGTQSISSNNDNNFTVNLDDRNLNYRFKELPSNVSVNSAHIVVSIYMGNMKTDYPVTVYMNLNNHLLLNKTLSTVYSGDVGTTVVDENITRVTSDYIIHYDVKDILTENNELTLTLSDSSYARIKLATLLVSYNDGDNDSYYYTINLGQDVANDDNYTGSTIFPGINTGSTIENVNLTAYYLASTNGAYRFNKEVLESTTPQAGYSGISSWNVTNSYKTGEDNILEYHKTYSASFYKIIMTTLLVKYYQILDYPDLIIQDIKINPDNNISKDVLYSDINNSIKISIANIGSKNAENFNISVEIGNIRLTKLIDSIGVNEVKDVIFDGIHNLVDGTNTIKVVLDREDNINEVSKLNNNKSVIINTTKFYLPDLNINSIKCSDNNYINKINNIRISVSNKGLAKSDNSIIHLYIINSDMQTQVYSRSIGLMEVNSTKILNFTWTPKNYGSYTIMASIESNDTESNYENNQYNTSIIIRNPDKISIFIISDNSGVNSYNVASNSIINKYPGVFDIQIRTSNQIDSMSDSLLSSYLSNADIFIGDWISTTGYEKLNTILSRESNITSNKLNKIFLILEPPVSSIELSSKLINYSTFYINGINKISDIHNINESMLSEYYYNTARGISYTNVYEYVNNQELFPSLYNTAILYKDIVNVEAYENLISWLISELTSGTFIINYSEVPSTLNIPSYGIYRDKWYSFIDNGTWHSGFEDYVKDHFKEGAFTVGLIESKMYVESQQLQTYTEIINQLEDLGLNVIPIVAYGGTSEQLEVMLKTFTNADNLSEFLNGANNTTRIDALINMVAYGLGGLDFSNITPFFTSLNVPILKAIHSDYVTNTEYNLGSTGLGAISGDKWWHITISEAQGTITPTFVGGYDFIIDKTTGASVSGYVPHTENINVLTSTVYNWIQLKKLANSEKKISILYYNYPPGKQNIAASYLDPVESILNLLHLLQDNGYDVKNIPKNSTVLLAQMLSQGTNVANWANGLVETMASNNNNSLQEIIAYQENNTYKLDIDNMTSDEIQSLEDTPGALLYPVNEFKKWYDKLDNLTKLSISEGPISYMGELSKIAVKSNYNLTSVIEEWHNKLLNLIPINKTSIITPLIYNIKEVLIKYVETHNESYYNQFLEYKQKFLSYNVEGLSGWGEFPGNIMVVERNNTKYFVLPGIQYGNVFIAPEPQRGWEGNAEQLYHNTVVPPHYQYLALYSYLQENNYNAMVFMGRHATHEWMGGKEVLCSYNDFTTILTGSVPQIYFYITDGISEALTAKRRGNAVIINHLTPPMSFTTLYGNLSNLQNLIYEHDEADNDQKAEILEKIIQLIKDNNYESDMGITLANLTDEEIFAASVDYLDSMTSTMYPYGVHVIGQDWSNDEIALLVSSMLSVEFEYNNAGDMTTLLNELSLLNLNKSYDELSSSYKSKIQEKSIEVLMNLMKLSKEDVINSLTVSPSEGLLKSIDLALTYIKNIKQSTKNEINSFFNALNGGYIVPGTGDDPINNPSSLPTGRNSYQDQSTEVPTPQAYNKSKELTELLLTGINETTRKIVMGIWDTETARDDGAIVAVVLRLLGIKPVWTDSPSAGTTGKKLKETPVYQELDELIRPDNWTKKRIDVVVVLDGNFRDLYSRQVGLLDKAFRIALARSYYTILNNETLSNKYSSNLTLALNTVMESIGYYGISNESLDENAIAYSWVNDFIYYIEKGVDPMSAGEYAINRIFAPPENDYGALISQAVRQSWTFNDTEELAKKYLNRMSYIYSSNSWGSYNTDVFKRVLSGSTNLFTSRNTNLYGIIDNDDYFDYWGGLYNLMFYLNNNYITFNILKYGSSNDESTLFSLDKYLNRELSSRYYNPSWIKSMMEEDYAGASYMSKFVSNLYGWQWTAQNEVKNWMWDKIVSVYIDDEYNLGVNNFLSNGYNSYSLISMTGTLLTSAYEGFWKTDENTLRKIANLHAKTVIDNGVACCDCSCGNIAMMDWSLKFVNADLLSQFKQKLFQATQNKKFLEDGFSEDVTSDGDNPTQNGTGTDDSGGSVNPDDGDTGTGNTDVNPGNPSGASETDTKGENNNNTGNTSNNTDSKSENKPTNETVTDTSESSDIKTNNNPVENNMENNTNQNEDSEDSSSVGSTNVGNNYENSQNSINLETQSNDKFNELEVKGIVDDSSLSEGELYQLSKAKKGSAITDTGMSFIAVMFIVVIISFIYYGYKKNS